MGFYEDISKYYDYIFPVGENQVKFLAKAAGNPPKEILDVACGTGGYSIELAKQGYRVTAVDLDNKMVEELKAKTLNSELNINAIQGNMLTISKELDSKYDLAFCIGNSLVHLEGEKEIDTYFKEMRSSLVENGSLVIQIINYDRVLTKDVRSLPTIENEKVGLKFSRLYRYDENLNKIYFKTILHVEDKEIENEIPLYPLLSEDMVRLLKNSGFSKFQLYGDFNGNNFDKDNSYALVVVAS